eukprot:3517262-Prymnesium_polylepis.1
MHMRCQGAWPDTRPCKKRAGPPCARVARTRVSRYGITPLYTQAAVWERHSGLVCALWHVGLFGVCVCVVYLYVRFVGEPERTCFGSGSRPPSGRPLAAHAHAQ